MYNGIKKLQLIKSSSLFVQNENGAETSGLIQYEDIILPV